MLLKGPGFQPSFPSRCLQPHVFECPLQSTRHIKQQATQLSGPCLTKHHLIALRSDDYIAQVSIGCMVPLLLQSWAEEADVWPLLLCSLILITAYRQAMTVSISPCIPKAFVVAGNVIEQKQTTAINTPP